MSAILDDPGGTEPFLAALDAEAEPGQVLIPHESVFDMGRDAGDDFPNGLGLEFGLSSEFHC